MTERKTDGCGVYYTSISLNHDPEAKKWTRTTCNSVQLNGNDKLIQPKGDYTIDENGWLVVKGKPLRPTRFARR